LVAPSTVPADGASPLGADHERTPNGRGRIVRKGTARDHSDGRALHNADLVGNPDAVAWKTSDIIEEVGGDGFLITDPELTRRYIAEISGGLVPALQKLRVVLRPSF